LGGFAEGDEFGGDGDAADDFDVEDGFEGFEVGGLGDAEALEEFFERLLAGDVFDGGLGADGGVAGEDEFGAGRVEAADQGDDGIVVGESGVVGRGFEFLGLVGLRMEIDDFGVAAAITVADLAEDEFLGAGDVEEGEIFRGRADEDEVIVFGVVEGEEAATFYAEFLVKEVEDTVEFVDGEDFADAGVVIEDELAFVSGGVVVAHADVGAAGEGGVAEDDPRFFGASEEAAPESMEGGRDAGAVGNGAGFAGFAGEEESGGDGE
jgi:hypothetical protein